MNKKLFIRVLTGILLLSAGLTSCHDKYEDWIENKPYEIEVEGLEIPDLNKKTMTGVSVPAVGAEFTVTDKSCPWVWHFDETGVGGVYLRQEDATLEQGCIDNDHWAVEHITLKPLVVKVKIKPNISDTIREFDIYLESGYLCQEVRIKQHSAVVAE